MGFSSFKSYGCKFSKKLLITILSPPPTPVTTTTKLLVAGGNGDNKIALSNDDGITWTLPNNQPFTIVGYGCAFDGNRIVMGGNENIAYSDDYGKTWISTGFATILYVYRIIYFTETNLWFAVGVSNSNQTIAYSNNGIDWISASNTPFSNCFNIVYNGSVYIAVGRSNSNYPMTTSPDGITWTLNETYIPDSRNKSGGFLFFDGNRYIFGGELAYNNGKGNIATSPDGITWDDTQNSKLNFDVRYIAYNGTDTYVACGSSNGFASDQTLFYYWSNDLINWTPANNNLMGTSVSNVSWNGKYFLITGNPASGSTTNIIYSQDGKTWTPSDNQPFSNNSRAVSVINY
jgi:hypothetical protein